MSLPNLQAALMLIRENPTADFVGPRTAESVAQAEQMLGVKFPESYRQFLLCLGAGSVRGCELYGIVDNEGTASGVPSVVWLTQRLRDSCGFPPSLIAISDTGYGGYHAIDTARGDSPVVEWQPFDASEACCAIADDFGAYLFEIAEWAKQP